MTTIPQENSQQTFEQLQLVSMIIYVVLLGVDGWEGFYTVFGLSPARFFSVPFCCWGVGIGRGVLVGRVLLHGVLAPQFLSPTVCTLFCLLCFPLPLFWCYRVFPCCHPFVCLTFGPLLIIVLYMRIYNVKPIIINHIFIHNHVSIPGTFNICHERKICLLIWSKTVLVNEQKFCCKA